MRSHLRAVNRSILEQALHRDSLLLFRVIWRAFGKNLDGWREKWDLRDWSGTIFALLAATFSSPDPVQEHYGMTHLGYSESITLCHSDNAPSQNLDLLVRETVGDRQFVGEPRTFHRRTGFNLIFQTPN